MRHLRTIRCAAALVGLAALGTAASHAQQQPAPQQPVPQQRPAPPHMCGAYTDAGSGQTRVIDMMIDSEEPFRGVVKLGQDVGMAFIGRRNGDRCALLTASGLRLQATCVPGAFAGSFTVSAGGDDDDDDGPPPVPVAFEPAACG